jgi:glycosyltransferase involved in cell wall biosynthesis
LPKPRLLIVLNRLSTGGPATNVLTTASMLSNEYDILLIAGEPLPHEQSAAYLLNEQKGFAVETVTTLRRSVIIGKDLDAYRAIKQKIKEFQPVIVHTHGAKPGLLGRFAAWRCKVPVIIHTFHGHIFHSYFNAFVSWLVIKAEQVMARMSTAVIAINEKLRRELVQEYKIAGPEKVKLIRLGIETEKFKDPSGVKRKTFRNDFRLAEDDIAVGIVGRLVPVKNHRLFVQSAALVLQQMKRVRFFVIGDGPEKTTIQQLLKQKNIPFANTNEATADFSAPFIFTSWRTDMNYVFAGLDITMLTSLNEGTPVSVMEAMAAGIPVISTPAGGVREVVIHGQTGILAADAAAIATAMMQLITNEQQRKTMGLNALDFAESAFSKALEVNKLSALYRQLLDGNTKTW